MQHQDMILSIIKFFKLRFSPSQGNILGYIVMTMVIFGVLGVTMVSMFSTSISSSATANESRRAFYMAESGLRYGLSELRQNGFATAGIDTLNNTEYKIPPSEAFDITVFGAWFKSPDNQSLVTKSASLLFPPAIKPRFDCSSSPPRSIHPGYCGVCLRGLREHLRRGGMVPFCVFLFRLLGE